MSKLREAWEIRCAECNAPVAYTYSSQPLPYIVCSGCKEKIEAIEKEIEP